MLLLLLLLLSIEQEELGCALRYTREICVQKGQQQKPDQLPVVDPAAWGECLPGFLARP